MLKPIDIIKGRISGLWKTTNTSTGKLGCFIKRLNNSNDSIGLIGFANPNELPFCKGIAIIAAAHYVKDLTDSHTPLYEAIVIDRIRDRQNLIKKFTSDDFDFLTPNEASIIVDAFGEEAYVRVIAEPNCLDNLSKLSPDIVNQIKKAVNNCNGVVGASAVIRHIKGITLLQAQDIFDCYDDDFATILDDNIYSLMFDINKSWAQNFVTVDKIAQENGVSLTSNIRLESSIRHYIIFYLKNTGDTSFHFDDDNFIDKLVYIVNTRYLFNNYFTRDIVKNMINNMPMFFKIINHRGYNICYPISFYRAETDIVSSIISRSNRKPIFPGTFDEIIKYIDEYETLLGLSLDSDQTLAVINSLMNSIYIITGGPGSGKTHTIGCILYIWARTCYEYNLRNNYILLAPTGQAAFRMKHVFDDTVESFMSLKNIGHDVGKLMIHLYKFCGTVSKALFSPASFFPDNSLVIVDESSMIGLCDMGDLISLFDKSQIICVGDVNQLPSISEGCVFSDMCHVNTLALNYGKHNPIHFQILHGNYRAKGSQALIENNNHVLKGDLFSEFNISTPAFRFHEFALENEDCSNKIIELYSYWLSKNFKPSEIKVLAAMKKGIAGVNSLNSRLQDMLNPALNYVTSANSSGHNLTFNQKGFVIDIKFSGNIFMRVGDRFVQLENDYDTGLVNGDTGVIDYYVKNTKNSAKSYIVVTLDSGEKLKIQSNNFSNMSLGYATTIHKAQGSEYPIVIFSAQAGLCFTSNRFASRNLLYTAISRAKKAVDIVGSASAIQKCIDSPLVKRKSLLPQRIIDSV